MIRAPRALFACAMWASLPASATSQAAEAPLTKRARVAVVEPQATGVSEAEVGELSNDIARELSKHLTYDQVSETEVDDAMAGRKSGRGKCADDEACLGSVGHAVSADLVLSGSLVKSRAGYTLELTLRPMSGSGGASRASEEMKQLKSLAPNVRICLDKLFKWNVPPAASAPVAAESHDSQAAAPAISPSEKAPAVAPAPVPPAAPGARRVMVLDLQAVAVDHKLVVALPSYIAQEVSRHPGFDVASSDDVHRLTSLEASKHAVGCTEDEDCITELSRKLDADLVISGSVGMVGTSYVLNLALMNPKDMKSTTRAVETVTRVEELQKAVGPALAKLFQWSGAAQAVAFQLPKGRKMSFAVFDLKPTGLTPETAANLTQVLTTEVKGVEGASVVSRDDIAAMLQLQSARMTAGCDDAGCMAEIGGALGVDRLITGDAGKVGTLYIVNLRLLDVRHGVVENRVTESFEGSEEQLLKAVRLAARNLLGLKAAAKGQLAITASQNAADVFVDDTDSGKAPAHLEGLVPGKHAVRVAAGGFFEWHGDVYVDPLETTSIWAQLNARPQAWYQKWWVWTIAGAVVAGATATTVVLTRPAPVAGSGSVTLK